VSKKQSIKTVGVALDELLGGLGIEKKLQEYDAVVFWDVVVGERIAQIAQAVKIAHGTLFVRVKTSTWRNELMMRKVQIKDKLNDYIGKETVKDIKFQ
jgi:predicted nucleic acid-binding Zn ribbon protein